MSTDQRVAEECARPCAAGQTRRGILHCVQEDRTMVGVAGAINCPTFSVARSRRPLTCASLEPETACADAGKCLRMEGTCCDDDFSLVRPTGSLGNMFCGSPGQKCSRCRCLPEDVRIATPDGDRPIGELAPGDRIWTETREGRRIAAALIEVARVPAPPGHRILEIVLEDGRIVRGSPTHPDADGVPLDRHTVGATLDGSRVVETRLLSAPVQTTYDVLPAGATGVYWADGVRLRSTIPGDVSRVARP